MRDLPILMSGPLVRAVLSGQKTQTRRPIKCMSNREHNGKLLGDWGLSVPPHQYDEGDEKLWHWTGKQKPQAGDWVEKVQCDVDDSYMAPVKGLASAGDRLWVRETWRIDNNLSRDRYPQVVYRADKGFMVARNAPVGVQLGTPNPKGDIWTPSIHMPRWACRLVLPLVKVRIERVQSISEADAWAEGYGEHWQRRVKEAGADGPLGRPDPRGWFAMLWDKLYGTWRQNPWVAVYEWGQIEVSR